MSHHSLVQDPKVYCDLEFLVYHSVTNITFHAIGVHQCFVIVIIVIVLCTDEFVD